MLEIIWKEIPNTQYLISSTGLIYSKIIDNLLSQFKDKDGYLQVNLQIGTRSNVTKRVHRLVAIAFLPNPHLKATVNHKDGIKTNNNIDNLEWCTHLENNQHAAKNNLMCHGSDIHTSLLNEEDVVKIKYLFVEHLLGDTEIGNMFGVNNSTISNIRRKIAWKHILPELEFEAKSPFGRGVSKKLHAEDIPIIRELSKSGLDNTTIAKKYNVAAATIRGILIGYTWKNY